MQRQNRTIYKTFNSSCVCVHCTQSSIGILIFCTFTFSLAFARKKKKKLTRESSKMFIVWRNLLSYIYRSLPFCSPRVYKTPPHTILPALKDATLSTEFENCDDFSDKIFHVSINFLSSYLILRSFSLYSTNIALLLNKLFSRHFDRPTVWLMIKYT